MADELTQKMIAKRIFNLAESNKSLTPLWTCT